MLIYGRDIRDKIKAQVLEKAKKTDMALAIIQVGDAPDAEAYIRSLHKFGEETNITVEFLKFAKDATEEEILPAMLQLNENPTITGIMLQEPLPKHINADRLVDAIDPKKDVEGVHNYNLGKLISRQAGVVPSTAQALITMLKEFNIPMAGKKTVVVGRSTIVGHPVANMMTSEDATVTLCHSRTVDLPAETRSADILIVAIGKAEFITADMVKEGAVILDAGINFTEEGKMVGDVHPEAKEKASYASAVPGGVGLITVAELFNNLCKLKNA
ncbi:MAG: bifunctional 5,10-methylenetetrahydrofolate dehydrogenase/5,10-methenyltetrahydrofolate cyclohydrolase [Syntrophomonadaceae bacterium]|nr:bifunctional 5,10-methylenetetrahydrofolate dehydrogenase/5,10-methenyltetrahydrofolate cyclohydrolase [Syntrophomonadaceae bacterium]